MAIRYMDNKKEERFNTRQVACASGPIEIVYWRMRWIYTEVPGTKKPSGGPEGFSKFRE